MMYKSQFRKIYPYDWFCGPGSQLSIFFPDKNDACNRCKQAPADHVHMFWSCPRLVTFWSNVFDTLGKALNVELSPNPLTAVFGVLPYTTYSSPIAQVVAFTTLLARRNILLKWRCATSPTHNRWIQDIFCFYIKLEKLRFILQGSLKTFSSTWDPFLNFIKSLLCPSDTDSDNT